MKLAPPPGHGTKRHTWRVRYGRSHLINRMRRFDRSLMQTHPWDPRYRETPWGISRHPDHKPLIQKGRKP